MGGNVPNMLLPVTLRDRGFLVLPGTRIRVHCSASTTVEFYECLFTVYVTYIEFILVHKL